MENFIRWLKTLFSPPNISAPEVSNPAYIDYSNDYIIPIPGAGDDTYLYCFPIDGTYQNMLNVVDQRLNFSPLNQKVRYFPLSEKMLLVFSDIKKGYTLDPNYKKYGFLEEKALQIFMPIVECTPDANKNWVAQRILFFIPYIFIDQPFSLSIGREVFGFEKSLANFEMPDSPATANNFQLNAFGFKNFDKLNPEFGKYHPLINSKKTDEKIEEGEWKTHNDAWEHIKQHLDTKKQNSEFSIGLPFIIHELKDLFHKTLPMIFLKQFRDIADPSKACYQAIVEGNGIADAFLGGWFLGHEYEITIEDVASFPIKEDLGLPDKILVSHPFWVHSNLRFDLGKVLWKSTT
jgi:hypothetical protein